MYHFLLVVHCFACLGMILFVLLQTGRGAGLSMFGGGGDSLISTPSGTSFMKKFTAGLAATFAFTSLFLTLLSDRTGMSSVTSRAVAPLPAPAAEAPAAAPAGPTSAAASDAYKSVAPAEKPAAKKTEAPKSSK
ncbi:MAG: preprotein translocase subunit SecG [Elusimicrobia bacterium]|nr:preprotein translocase subunit SecG [Elusimicrobiota bacterium]